MSNDCLRIAPHQSVMMLFVTTVIYYFSVLIICLAPSAFPNTLLKELKGQNYAPMDPCSELNLITEFKGPISELGGQAFPGPFLPP